MTPPAVSQRLAQIEDRLHLRLIERGRGPLRLTAEGAFLIERASGILGELETLADEMAARAGRIEGPLQVIAPFGFGRLRVAPILSRFAGENPELSPSLVLSEDPLGAMRAGPWDVMIHVGRLPDLRIMQRKLATNRRFLVAAPSYAARFGLPQDPGDIAGHRVGVVREDRADTTLWPLTGPDGSETSLRVHPVFACNDGEVVRAWALDGFGIMERLSGFARRPADPDPARLVPARCRYRGAAEPPRRPRGPDRRIREPAFGRNHERWDMTCLN